MMFDSREDAGRQLGEYLAEMPDLEADIVLGLPRGGVVVAWEVARVLHKPLDVLVVRKIGHPFHREFAVGALAEDGTKILHEGAMGQTGVDQSELNAVVAEELNRLREYRGKFHKGGIPDLAGKNVLIVDDGLATGSTCEVAAMAARHQKAASVIVAVPVSSDSAEARLSKVADEVIALDVDPNFMAVGQYYRVFGQTTDEEVQEILDAREGALRP